MLPLPCEINVFTVQDPSKNGAKSLQKKTLQPDPPKMLNFQLQGASGWQHEPKRLPKGFLLRGPGAAQKHHFCCPKLSWGQDGPQESPSLDFGSSSDQFWIIFTCFRNLFLSTCFILSGHQWSVSNPLPVWSSLASLQEFLRGATSRSPHESA